MHRLCPKGTESDRGRIPRRRACHPWRVQPDDSAKSENHPDATAGAATQAAARAWLRVAQAADYANLSADTIYTACERGELQHVRVGGRRSIRTRAQWVDAWLEKYTRGA